MRRFEGLYTPTPLSARQGFSSPLFRSQLKSRSTWNRLEPLLSRDRALRGDRVYNVERYHREAVGARMG